MEPSSSSKSSSINFRISEFLNQNGETVASASQNPTNIDRSLLSSISAPQYENVSDVESVHTDSEGDVKEEEEDPEEAMTAAKFLSTVYFEPSVVNHSEKRHGVLESVTQASQGKLLGEPEAEEEPVPEEFEHTDCEECQAESDSESDCLPVSESGLQRYLETVSCLATSETAECLNEARRASDISDIEEGDWMELEDEERRNSVTEDKNESP